MSKQDRTPFSQGTALISIVAALACAFPGNAHAIRPPIDCGTGVGTLSARVAAVAKRIRLIESALPSDLPSDGNVALFGN